MASDRVAAGVVVQQLREFVVRYLDPLTGRCLGEDQEPDHPGRLGERVVPKQRYLLRGHTRFADG